MANYGLEVTNTGGLVQVDSVFSNLEVLVQGQVTGPPIGQYVTTRYIAIPPTPQPPLIFFQSPIYFGNYGQVQTFVAMAHFVKSGSMYVGANVQVYDYGPTHHPTRGGGAGANAIRYFLFFIAGVATVNANESYGLQVFSDTGQILFDSNNRYLTIVDTVIYGNRVALTSYYGNPVNPDGGYSYFGESIVSHKYVSAPYYSIIGQGKATVEQENTSAVMSTCVGSMSGSASMRLTRSITGYRNGTGYGDFEPDSEYSSVYWGPQVIIIGTLPSW